MTIQIGFKYVNPDGTLNEAGYAAFSEMEEKIQELLERIAELEEEE